MKKIDIHCHTTPRKIAGVLPESATLDSIAIEMNKHEIEKTAVLATYFPHKGSGISNYRLLRWINDRPEFMMFGSLDFEHYFYQGLNELTELAEEKLIQGIKIYTCYQNIDLGSARFNQLVSLAKEHSLPMMFHCGESYACKRKYGRVSITDIVKASRLETLAQENRDVDFIVSHMSKPFFKDAIQTINNNQNMYADMSGLIDSKFDRDQIPNTVDQIKKFLDICGSEKLLFGTDFPVQTHEDSVYFIEKASKDYSFSEKQNIYRNNARRLLK